MKTVFLFAISAKREQTEFIKELPFPLYPTGLIELENGSQYQIQLIETELETGYINVYLKDQHYTQWTRIKNSNDGK